MEESKKHRNINSHWKIIDGKKVPKKAYNTERQALDAAFRLNSCDHVIHKMVAYKCRTCDKWHIGSNGRELTNEDREHYKELIRNNTQFYSQCRKFFHGYK